MCTTEKMELNNWLKKNYPEVWNEYLKSELVDLTPTDLDNAENNIVDGLDKNPKPNPKQRGYTKKS